MPSKAHLEQEVNDLYSQINQLQDQISSLTNVGMQLAEENADTIHTLNAELQIAIGLLASKELELNAVKEAEEEAKRKVEYYENQQFSGNGKASDE